MNSFAEFWDSLGYNKFFLAALIVLFVIHVISILYRSSVLLTRKKQPTREREEGVSVIITSNNKAELLKENLEHFLTQDYPQFEVILVDECSEDDTQDVLSDLQSKYPHLRTTRIFPETKFRKTKKIAINIGVLAAQYDILLFTEIECIPESKNWIRSMQSNFTNDTAVVVGYANYAVDTPVGNISRYFRFLWFWKAMVFVKNGINLIGNGFNMGYRKRYYLEKRGFTGNTQEYIGYDTEMVKELSRKGDVRVVKDPDSRMIIGNANKRAWIDDFSYYYATQRRWPSYTKLWSNLDFIVEMLFYVLAFYFLFTGLLHYYMAIPIVLTFLIDIIMLNIGLKHLGQKKLFITSFTVNIFGFIYKWYYSIYSLSTSKKWK